MNDICHKFYQRNTENDTLEICLVLFKKCNLNCQFCFQDRSESVDVEYIDGIPTSISSPLSHIISERQYKRVVYRIWGGELFSDDIPDHLFITYEKLVTKLRDLGDSLGITSVFCFTSNLVFSKTGRVIQLLRNTGSVIATSYDPIYRFRDRVQLDMWEKNARIFDVDSVSITLTRQNISEYVSVREHLDRIRNYHVNIEYYIYNRKHEFFSPSEDDLYDFIRYCIDNGYDNIDEVLNIKESIKSPNGRYCTCNNSCLYLDGKLTFNCLKRSSNLPLDEFFEHVPEEKEYTEVQLLEALRRKQCMSCENFSFCRMYCMASVLHRSRDVTSCGMRKIYQYLRETGNG